MTTSAPSSASSGPVGQQPVDVGQLALQVREVGADEAVGVDDRVVDADLEPLADEALGELEVGALTQVVGVHLEAEPEDRDAAVVGREDPVDDGRARRSRC